MRCVAPILLCLVLIGCGEVRPTPRPTATRTPTPRPTPTPWHLTIAAVLVAWEGAGLVYGDGAAFGEVAPPAAMGNHPGVVRRVRFDVGGEGPYFLFEFAEHADAIAAHEAFRGGEYTSYRLQTVIMAVPATKTRAVSSHLAVFLTLRE